MTPRPHVVEVYRDQGGLWRWRRKAGNYKIIAASEQGHMARWYAKRKARRLNPGVEVRVVTR